MMNNNFVNIKGILQSKLAKSTGITMVGSGLSKLILIIATFVCARMLTKNEFGEFSFIRNTLITVLSVSALRFGTLCTKFTVEAVSSRSSRTRLLLLLLFSFFISLLVGVLLLILPESVLLSIFDTKGAISYFRIIGVFLPVFMLQPLVESMLRGLMEFKTVAYMQVAMSILFLVSLSLCIHFYDLFGAFIALLIYYITYSIASVIVFCKHKDFAIKLREVNALSSEKVVLYTMIIPTFITSFIDAPVYWICQAIMANQYDMSAVGTMSAIVQLRNTAFVIPAFFFSTYMAFAGQLNSNKQYGKYYSQFNKLIVTFIVIGVLLSVFLSLFAAPILSLFGKHYVGDTEPLYVANVTIPFYLLFSLLNIHMVIKEHQRSMLLITLCSEVLSLLVFVLLLSSSQMFPVTTYFISQIVLVATKFLCYYIFYSYDKHKISI